jgi:glycosyltransferase involved in cell wall biosynthesis
MHLSVVLPCYNEEHNAATTVRDVAQWMRGQKFDGEIIAVDDGSKDDTGRVLESLRMEIPELRVIRHVSNQGYGGAIRSGCDVARGDIIVFMDSDGQFRAEDIGFLLPLLRDVPFVTGIRTHRADPIHRKFNAWLYGKLIRCALRLRFTDLNCGLKAFRRDLWSTIRPLEGTGALFNAEMYARLSKSKKGFREVHVNHYPRLSGKQTGANISVIVRMFKELSRLKKKMSTQ